MIIAVFSDSHDNIWNLSKAMKVVLKEQTELLIHCGDYCAPFMLAELAGLKGEVHGVFGNVDGDRFLMADFTHSKFRNITLHGEIGELDIDNSKVAFVHNPKVGKALAAIGDYCAVFYGHTHEQSIEKVGECLVVNPGEIMGRISKPSFCFFDTEKKEVKHVELS